MATKALTFELFGHDRTASAALRGVGTTGERLNQTMRKVGAGIAVGLGIAAAAATAYGIASVKAFAEAQAQQEKLNFAYEKFPAIADVTRASYDELNKALMVKTGFDDDSIASGQGVLAQFGLTGKQLQRLTPLLLDYARATGQDVVSAAEDVGKAMLGQGRALKGIGIDFQDAGSVAANFDQVMAGLTTNVGGYAEEFGTTAAGKFEILTARLGEMQETIGAALLPSLLELADFVEQDVLPKLESFAGWLKDEGIPALMGFAGWVAENGPLVLGLGAVTAAAYALNVAMNLNPAVLAFSALSGAVLILLAAINWVTNDTANAQSTILGFAATTLNFIIGVNNGISSLIIGGLNGIIDLINGAISAYGTLLSFIGVNVPIVQIPHFSNASTPTNFGVSGSSILGGSKVGLGVGSTGGRPARPMADGGLVKGGRGGVFAMIGEKNYDELVVPLKSGNSMLGGNTTVIVNVNGAVGNEDFLAKTVVRAVQNSQKRGQTPRGALA